MGSSFGITGGNLTSTDNSTAAAFATAFDLLQNSIVRGQWVGKLGKLGSCAHNFPHPRQFSKQTG